MRAITLEQSGVPKPWAWVKSLGINFQCFLDGGTDLNLMDAKISARIGDKAKILGENFKFLPSKADSENPEVTAAGGSRLIILGRVILVVSMGKFQFETVFTVVDNLGVDSLLSNSTMNHFHMNVVNQPGKVVEIHIRTPKGRLVHPVEMEDTRVASAYLTTLREDVGSQINAAEVPNFFVGRGEEKEASF
jgi:hypothetical protein